MNVPLLAWFAVLALIVGMLTVDLLAHRRAHVVSLREAAAWSAVWILVGLGFGALVGWFFGGEAAGQYFAGYLVEKSLSVDNVFVFALVLGYLGVPREHQHRVLFFGVLGALALRAAFIAGGLTVLEHFHWVLFVFGGLLVLTGVRMYRHPVGEADPSRSPALRVARRLVPATSELHGQRFWVRSNGRRLATPLFFALVLVESSDLMFAVDSVPAVLAVTQEPFLVFTSNAFAILGLRALYFLLADLMHRFVHLKTGLATILVFVGLKMLLADVVEIPVTVSLAVIAVCVTVAVVASLRATAGKAGRGASHQSPAGGEVVCHARLRVRHAHRSRGSVPSQSMPRRSVMGEAAEDRMKAAELPEGDVIRILLEQHARIRELFSDVKSAEGEHKEQAFDELRALLAVHETAEEMVVRPVSKSVAGASVADSRNEEEEEANKVLKELESLDCSSAEFDKLLADFEKSVDEHAEKEESEEFPAILAECDEAKRASMGKQVKAAESVAPTHPHPSTAGSPGAQWAVGPFASLVDRTKDLIKKAS